MEWCVVHVVRGACAIVDFVMCGVFVCGAPCSVCSLFASINACCVALCVYDVSCVLHGVGVVVMVIVMAVCLALCVLRCVCVCAMFCLACVVVCAVGHAVCVVWCVRIMFGMCCVKCVVVTCCL